MLALLQRVSSASVTIQGRLVADIAHGLLALVCAEPHDTKADAQKLVQRMLKLRIFSDAEDKMNLSVQDCGGALLLVPQFTLAADTRGGNRPSFSGAAPPDLGRQLFEYAVQYARTIHPVVNAGVFGADMKVALVNDGPVTVWLKTGATPKSDV